MPFHVLLISMLGAARSVLVAMIPIRGAVLWRLSACVPDLLKSQTRID